MTDGPAPAAEAPHGPDPEPRVGLVIVSHSSRIAEGIVELAGQMAGGIRIVAAGGTDAGGIGTSFDRVLAAIAEADGGAGVVALCDLGSAVLTTETALDFLDDHVRERVRIADAPIVEGSVAAAVAAESGETLAGVLAAGESAGAGVSAAAPPPADSPPAEPSPAEFVGARHPDPSAQSVSETGVLTNRDGLHARPAAEFVKLASTFDAKVTVNGVDAKSLLRIMSLGLAAGRSIEIEGSGPDAAAAVTALVTLIESGFGEA